MLAMKEVTTHYAKTHLSRLLKDVQTGESVVILQGKTPVGKLTAVKSQKIRHPKVGTVTSAPITYTADAFDPMTEEDLREWGL
jgi:antitoxin (DNA-binding transcriptional repressor) of toxin-antitoxin stability system